MTLQLFFASGASSMAPHILLEESGLSYVTHKVDLVSKTWKEGNYNKVNPKSYVPTLILDDGTILTECAVILEYVANKAESPLIEKYNSTKYWEQRTWLNYIATELHKNFISPYRTGNWLPNTMESKKLVYQRIYPRLKFIEDYLATGHHWLVGNKLSAADPYLFVMTNWMRRLEFGLYDFPELTKFDNRMRQRPAVKKVLEQEGKPHSLTDGE